MKFSATLLVAAFSALVAAEGLPFFGSSSNQAILGDGAPIPGDNPLTYCKKDHADDILALHSVDLTPNPPTRGTTLTIEAVGDLLEEVAEGAYVVLTVKYGYIKLVNTEADLCEQVKNVDMECPIKEGLITITKDVQLPDQIPPGTYNVFADAYTARPESKHIMCLEATVAFT